MKNKEKFKWTFMSRFGRQMSRSTNLAFDRNERIH